MRLLLSVFPLKFQQGFKRIFMRIYEKETFALTDPPLSKFKGTSSRVVMEVSSQFHDLLCKTT